MAHVLIGRRPRSSVLPCMVLAATRVIALVALAGCEVFISPTPTPTASPTPRPFAIPTADAALPTRLPAAQIEDMLATAFAGFTPSAPEVVGELRATVTHTPMPTEARIPMQFFVSDGLRVLGSFYGAPTRPAPVVLLIHGDGGSREDWAPFATQLQAAGFDVLALDLRGHGMTEGAVNWSRVPEDVVSIFTRLIRLPGVDGNRAYMAGAGVGANVALAACAEVPECRAAALISPTLSDQGVEAEAALPAYGLRPLLIAVSRLDQPSAADSLALRSAAQGITRLLTYNGVAHGTALLAEEPALGEIIIRWLGNP